ncbi:transposase family protein [Rhizobium leguminosarum]|uniref:integrase catalytic domain-containing protein n=1 Tax=Rhizobium leguminosarum TaxID=384 RepID=UPI001C984FDA|nr:transposase family protein [Rhizobium leguminosarum]MBY5774235.1 transposase family protein [Rhizobium leguminosarum]
MGFARGDCYRVTADNRTRDYTFVKKLAGGSLIFLDESTGRPERIEEAQFAKWIKENAAAQQLSSNWVDRIDIHALMDATLPDTPLETKKRIESAQEKVAEGLMYRYYARTFDEKGDVSKSTDGLNEFIEKTYGKACRAGHFRKPSASGLSRALRRSVPHERDLADLISKQGAHSKRVWKDPWVKPKLNEAVEHFYQEGNPKPPELQEAVFLFLGQAVEEDRARRARGEEGLEYPKRTAVENYIRDQETRERLARRDPIKALQRYGARASGATAEFPLQLVQVDQTQVDEWIPIYDEDGNVEDRKRPYLVSIVDVYSRILLAAILTFEKPSTLTVQLAIKQMLRPKIFLIERFGVRKGATDGYGQPKKMLFDNGVENIGVSMRALLGDAGIDMDAAPKATPQAKAIVESGFNTYNKGIWHKAPGGIPYKPHVLAARRLKPEEKADWALRFAEGVMWHWIVNVHHLSRNRTLEAVPVRMWSKISDPMVGRSVSKRLDLVDIICGTRLRLRIDRNGVVYENHVFHHPDVTEDFLIATVPKEGRSGRGKVKVEAIIYKWDCSHIVIVDHVRKRFVRLPNSKPRFAEGLSYAEADLIKASDRRLDKHFVDEEELILAKYEYYKLIDNARAMDRAERAIRQAKRAAKKEARQEELVIWNLVEGDHIEIGSIEPTVQGTASYDVQQEMPAMVRKAPQILHKDQPRGAQKARETRELNKQVKQLRNLAAPPAVPPPSIPGPQRSSRWMLPIIESPDSFLDALADDLD